MGDDVVVIGAVRVCVKRWKFIVELFEIVYAHVLYSWDSVPDVRVLDCAFFFDRGGGVEIVGKWAAVEELSWVEMELVG